MANYINQTIFCQAYIHINNAELSDGERKDFEQFIHDFTLERGQFFFDEKSKVDIQWKDGSDIYYMSLIGLAGGLYAAICKYPDFREGVSCLARDGYRFTAGIISESLFRLKSNQFDSIRIESRAGIFMRLDNCITKTDTLKGLLERRSINSIINKLEDLEKYCVDTLYRIDDPADSNYVREELREIVKSQLPPNLPSKRRTSTFREDNSSYKARRNRLLRELGKFAPAEE